MSNKIPEGWVVHTGVLNPKSWAAISGIKVKKTTKKKGKKANGE